MRQVTGAQRHNPQRPRLLAWRCFGGNALRDPANRLRMCAAPYGSSCGRTAASNYEVLRQLAGGGAALVQWRLESGRTHQIR